jgi:heme/copper-type cytochrome/quinol oxidase subunit 4
MTKNKLYSLVLIACSAGFIYLLYHLYYSESSQYSVCMIKNVTGFPCPSCGTTRAVQLMFQWHFIDSVMMNPFGIIISAILTLLPFWVVIDLILKRDTFLKFYKQSEIILRQKKIAIPLIILVILNWIWNIIKLI